MLFAVVVRVVGWVVAENLQKLTRDDSKIWIHRVAAVNDSTTGL